MALGIRTKHAEGDHLATWALHGIAGNPPRNQNHVEIHRSTGPREGLADRGNSDQLWSGFLQGDSRLLTEAVERNWERWGLILQRGVFVNSWVQGHRKTTGRARRCPSKPARF